MLSTRPVYPQIAGVPVERSWSRANVAPTFLDVEAVAKAERVAFRRRLGVTLTRIRTELTEYTQATIAEELGVDTETVGRWERGEREPKTWQLSQLVEKYDLPPDVAAWVLFPTDSLTELDRRIAEIRTAQLRRAAEEAARHEAAEDDRRGGGGASARRGRSRA